MLKKIVLSSTLASMFLVGSLYAQHGGVDQNPHAKKTMHSSHAQHEKMHLVKKIVAAVSKTGLNSNQVSKITDAINNFKSLNQAAKQSQMFPIDAMTNDKFDAKVFMDAKSQMFNKKMESVVELFDSIYATLTPEQRKVFKQEFTAPMVAKMIQKGMIKGMHKGKNAK